MLRKSDKYVSSGLFPGRYEIPLCFLFKLGCRWWRSLLRVGDECAWIYPTGIPWRVCEVRLERVILYSNPSCPPLVFGSGWKFGQSEGTRGMSLGKKD
jgi:hypothetical protein